MEGETSKIMLPAEGTMCQPWYFPHSNQTKCIHLPDPLHHESSSSFHSSPLPLSKCFSLLFSRYPNQADVTNVWKSILKKNSVAFAQHFCLKLLKTSISNQLQQLLLNFWSNSLRHWGLHGFSWDTHRAWTTCEIYQSEKNRSYLAGFCENSRSLFLLPGPYGKSSGANTSKTICLSHILKNRA